MTKPRMGNIRAYLASTGATGALIAAAVVAFLTVGALVAFDGFPLFGDDADGSVSLAEQPGGLAPESAAAALGATAGAVAASPDGGSVLAANRPGAGGPGGASGGPGSGATGGTGSGDNPSLPTSGGSTGIVNTVDDTTGGSGLPPLGPATSGVTEPVDQAVNDTLNDVGGAVGQPNLGNQVNDTVGGLGNQVNDTVGGLTGNQGLLGGG